MEICVRRCQGNGARADTGTATATATSTDTGADTGAGTDADADADSAPGVLTAAAHVTT